jgi:hypothetical protein
MVVHDFLAEEAGSTEGNPPHPELLSHVLELGLIVEASGNDVHGEAQIAKLPRQLEYENNLSAGIGQTQLGFGAYVAVDRKHQDSRLTHGREGHRHILPARNGC